MAVSGTGVTIGSRAVRVLQVKRDKAGAWAVERVLISSIAEDASGARAAAEARAAVMSAQAKGRALVGLSGKDLIVRYTQVPPVPDWRLAMLMDFEIQEVSEQSGGDVSAAYTLLDVDDTTTGDNVVLVALAKNAYLAPRLAALQSAGLQVLGGAPRALGAYWAYKENGHLRFDETVVILHIGHENTDVAVSRNGHLLFARNVSGGSKLFTDALAQNMRVNAATAEKLKVTKGNVTPRGKARYRDANEEKVANQLISVAGHFVSAVNSTVMFAKAQTKVPEVRPDRVVVMGGGALLRGLPEYLESNLNLPVELFDPVDALDLSSLSSEQQEALRKEAGSIAVTLGLAQMAADPEALRVEVLPPAERKRRKMMQETVPVIVSAAVLAVALIISFVSSGSAAEEGRQEKQALEAVRERYRQNEQEFEKSSKEVEVLNDEKYRLRSLLAMGPATQDVLDSLQGTLKDFDEIFVEKVISGVKTVQRTDDKGNSVSVELPSVEFIASIQPLGNRAVAVAYSDFVTAFNRLLNTKKPHLTFIEMGGFDAKSGTFKFRVEQEEFPEKANPAK